MNHSNIRRTPDEKAERAERIQQLKAKYSNNKAIDQAVEHMADRMAHEIVMEGVYQNG